MKWPRLGGERGSVMFFLVLMLPLLFWIGGFGVDIGHVLAVRTELSRSMAAAALAGAGKLGFSDAAFPAVRTNAQTYANHLNNRYAGQVVGLTDAEITLGIYDGRDDSFIPSANGSMVNAVRCQVTRAVPSLFLGLVGLSGPPARAEAIAVSNPPATIPPDGCMFPQAVSSCSFQTGGGFSSGGCGQVMSTYSPSTTNTAAWINLQLDANGVVVPSSSSSANNILDVMAASAAPTCHGTTLRVGDTVGANNGEVQVVFNGTGQQPGLGGCDSSGGNCTGIFVDKYNSGAVYTVEDSGGTTTYSGGGWQVYVAVISTSCPPGAITGSVQIATFARVVITQVINNGYCVVANHAPQNIWDQYCPTPNGTAASRISSLSAVFGYYDCGYITGDSTVIPGPRVALGTRLRLVRQ
jgi:hypothetical protein